MVWQVAMGYLLISTHPPPPPQRLYVAYLVRHYDAFLDILPFVAGLVS